MPEKPPPTTITSASKRPCPGCARVAPSAVDVGNTAPPPSTPAPDRTAPALKKSRRLLPFIVAFLPECLLADRSSYKPNSAVKTQIGTAARSWNVIGQRKTDRSERHIGGSRGSPTFGTSVGEGAPPERRPPPLVQHVVDLPTDEVAEPEAIQPAPRGPQITPEERAEHGEESTDRRRLGRRQPSGRLEERESQRDVFGHVAMLERHGLVRDAARDQPGPRSRAVQPVGRAGLVIERRQ